MISILSIAIPSAIAALGAWAASRASSKASVVNNQTSSRTEMEKEAYDRARKFDTETIARQDAEIEEVRSTNRSLNDDLRILHADNRMLHADNEKLRIDNHQLREDVKQLRAAVARLQYGVDYPRSGPGPDTEPMERQGARG